MSLILETENLSKSYLGKTALNKMCLQVETGKIVGILGPNGSGKTTFLKLIAGLLNRVRGALPFAESPLASKQKN